MKTFILGATENPKVEVSVLGYEREVTGEYYDDNWVKGHVLIRVGAFYGEYDAAFTTGDFLRLRDELQPLFETLSGQAQFSTLEGQLEFTLIGNGRGEIQVKGSGSDQLCLENELRFEFCLDQTYLPKTLRGLNEIISEFSTRPA
jgi:hypothetical protein